MNKSENIKAAIQKMSEVTQKVDVEAGVIDKRNRLMEIIEAIGSSSKLASNVLSLYFYIFIRTKKNFM